MTPNSAAAPWTGDVRRRFVVGVVGSLLAVVASMWGHLRGGGSLDMAVRIIPLLLAVPLVAASTARREWSFRRQVGALVLLQPIVHLLMSHHGSVTPGPMSMDAAGSQMAGHHPAHTAVEAGLHGGLTGSWSMPLMHASIVVVLAVTLRYGWRWISSMPSLFAAAVALAQSPTSLWCPSVSALAVAPQPFAPAMWTPNVPPARGPPR